MGRGDGGKGESKDKGIGTREWGAGLRLGAREKVSEWESCQLLALNSQDSNFGLLQGGAGGSAAVLRGEQNSMICSEK